MCVCVFLKETIKLNYKTTICLTKNPDTFNIKITFTQRIKCGFMFVTSVRDFVAQLQPHLHDDDDTAAQADTNGAVGYRSLGLMTELPRGSCTSGTLSADFTLALWDSPLFSLLQLLMSLMHIFPLRYNKGKKIINNHLCITHL